MRPTIPLRRTFSFALFAALLAASPARAAFVDTGFDVPLLNPTASAWGDFDRDGDLDFVLTGQDGTPPYTLRAFVFRNDAGAFTDAGAGLTGLANAAAAWGDYDNDGDLDLLMCGNSSSLGDVPTTRLYRNDGGAFTSLGAAGLPEVRSGSVAFGDYDRDGDLDVLITGYRTVPSSSLVGAIYRNDGGVFTDAGAGLPPLFYSSAAFGDYDADGDLDLAIQGTNSSVNLTRIYRNDGGTFTNIAAPLVGQEVGDVAWVDFDGDGDLDLSSTGFDGAVEGTRLYRNNGGFTSVATGLPGASRGAAWGDFDNDGDPDLALTGIGTTPSLSRIYRNDGGGAFADIAAGIAGTRACTPAWADFDGDGDLDLLIAGGDGTGVRKLYRNTGASVNHPPQPPSTLIATECVDGELKLRWGVGSDLETAGPGLTYNLRVGTTWGGNEIVSCPADPASGQAQLAQPGNVGHATSVTLALPPGTYYWTVQTVDGAFLGSDFAPVHVVQAPSVDGAWNAAEGPPSVTQSLQTGFGDASLGLPDFANGSELDGAYARLDDCALHLFLPGNLESNFNKLELFFDTLPGGQNQLRGDNANVDFDGLNRMGDDGSGNGLRFDPAFEPDFYVTLSGGDAGGDYTLFASWAELLSAGGGLGRYLGSTTPPSNGALAGGDNPDGILATIDNSNTAGVTAGTGGASGSGVTTGVELVIPLASLGNPTGCFEVCAFVNGSGHDFVSNQVLAPLVAPQGNLGEPRNVDFGRYAGEQWFSVCPGATADVPAGPAASATRGRLSAFPNPMRASSLVRFELARAGEASVELFNVQGRRVRRLVSGAFDAGPHQALWTGTDDSGRALPSGVYYARLLAPGERASHALILRR